ncbi:hypothetical protein L3X38_026057 [Prunus dulcis]|uniref:Uncharacterized protein n=1 Tax=Prunus dulcis TaxID=3755 RepID=A0AAD4W411_PRUDU|nr:hypothetical protein L3X38_026057 [Prunus dulcis]
MPKGEGAEGHHSMPEGRECRRHKTCISQDKVLKAQNLHAARECAERTRVSKAQDLRVIRELPKGKRLTCHKGIAEGQKTCVSQGWVPKGEFASRKVIAEGHGCMSQGAVIGLEGVCASAYCTLSTTLAEWQIGLGNVFKLRRHPTEAVGEMSSSYDESLKPMSNGPHIGGR